MITVVSGDIFTCGADAITNTINCRGAMGAGIAKEFKKRYPDMYNEYVTLCKKGKIRVGEVWVWLESVTSNPKYIVNFPTKDDWKNPSQLIWIKAGLANLKSHVIMKEITSLALPALGCNLGGLDFADVRKLVEETFGDAAISVTLFEPK